MRFISASFTRSSSFYARVSGSESGSLISSSFIVTTHKDLGGFEGDFTDGKVTFTIPSQSAGGSSDVKALVISASGNSPRVGIGVSNPLKAFDFKDVSDTTRGGEILIRSSRTAKGAEIGDEAGRINFVIDSSSYAKVETSGSVAEIIALVDEADASGVRGSLSFRVSAQKTEDSIEKIRITPDKTQVTGSFVISGSNSFINIGPAEFSGSVAITDTLEVDGAVTHNGVVTHHNDVNIYSGGLLNVNSTSGAKIMGAGLSVGSLIIPAEGQLRVQDYGMFLGGIHVGGTTDPGLDNLLVDGTTTLVGDTIISGSDLFFPNLTAGATGNYDKLLIVDSTGQTRTLAKSLVPYIEIFDGAVPTNQTLVMFSGSTGDVANATGVSYNSAFGWSFSGVGSVYDITADDIFVTNDLTAGGDISVTGTVDGVDIATLKSDFDTLEGKTLVSGSSQITIGSTTGTITSAKISDVDAFSQSGTYASLRAQGTTAGDVGLGNVTNESKATMFTSPTFTGTPVAPTPSTADDSTKIATTAYVQANLDNLIGNAGAALDTLGELSASLADATGSIESLVTEIDGKLAKASNLSDLTNTATARTNLGVDAAGTDNSTDVTLAGSYDYITISGQQITRNQIDASTDISNLTTTNVSEGTNEYYTDAKVKTKLNTENVVSSSAQIDHDATTNFSADEHFTQANITTVGTIGTGIWQGTAIADGYISSATTWNNKLDSAGTIATNDYAKFDASGDLVGRSYSEVKTDLSLNNVENTALSTYTGNGGALDNQYITNGAGYTTNTGTVTSVGGTGTVSGLSLSGTVTTSGNLTLGGTISISSTNITDVDAFSQTGTYASLRAQGTTAGDVGLGNVTNESKATMFTSPTFTGTVAIPGFPDVSASLAAAVAGGDNLGNHTATQNLNMGTYAITNVGNVDGVDVSTLKSDFDTLEGKTLVSSSAQTVANLDGQNVTVSRLTVKNSIDHLKLQNDAGTVTYVNFSPQGGLEIDLGGAGNSISASQNIKTHGDFIGESTHIKLIGPDGGGGSFTYLSSSGDPAAGGFKLSLGDIDGVGNTTTLIIDDGAEQISLSKALSVTGNITVTGTVDGVDVSALNSTVSTNTSNISTNTTDISNIERLSKGRITFLYTGSVSYAPPGYIAFYDIATDYILINTSSYNGVDLDASVANNYSKFQFNEPGSLITVRKVSDGSFKTYKIISATTNYSGNADNVGYLVDGGTFVNVMESGSISDGDEVEFIWDKSAGVGGAYGPTVGLGIAKTLANFYQGGYNYLDMFFGTATDTEFDGDPENLSGVTVSSSFTDSSYFLPAISQSATLTLGGLTVNGTITGTINTSSITDFPTEVSRSAAAAGFGSGGGGGTPTSYRTQVVSNGFYGQADLRYLTFNTTGETTGFNYLSLMPAPADGRVISISVWPQANGGSTVMGFHKNSNATPSATDTQTLSLGVPVTFTFSSGNTFSQNDELSFSIDPTSTPNGLFFSIILEYDY